MYTQCHANRYILYITWLSLCFISKKPTTSAIAPTTCAHNNFATVLRFTLVTLQWLHTGQHACTPLAQCHASTVLLIGPWTSASFSRGFRWLSVDLIKRRKAVPVRLWHIPEDEIEVQRQEGLEIAHSPAAQNSRTRRRLGRGHRSGVRHWPRCRLLGHLELPLPPAQSQALSMQTSRLRGRGGGASPSGSSTSSPASFFISSFRGKPVKAKWLARTNGGGGWCPLSHLAHTDPMAG
jgi:hypothetical protein